MIPISQWACLTCRRRYGNRPPVYCATRIVHPDGHDMPCPGPLFRLLVDEPEPPRLTDHLEDAA